MTPRTERASALTGKTGPAKLPRNRCSRIAWPILDGSVDAPITATDDGCSALCTLRASARCSRESRTASDRSVGSMSNSRCSTPSAKARLTW